MGEREGRSNEQRARSEEQERADLLVFCSLLVAPCSFLLTIYQRLPLIRRDQRFNWLRGGLRLRLVFDNEQKAAE